MQPEDTDGTVEAKSSKSDEQKSWLITPTLAADPKLGTNLGGVIAYLKQLDSESTPSMLGLSVSYSDTDSISGGIGAQLYWRADSRRLTMLLGAPRSITSTTIFWALDKQSRRRTPCIRWDFVISTNFTRQAGLPEYRASAQTTQWVPMD